MARRVHEVSHVKTPRRQQPRLGSNPGSLVLRGSGSTRCTIVGMPHFPRRFCPRRYPVPSDHLPPPPPMELGPETSHSLAPGVDGEWEGGEGEVWTILVGNLVQRHGHLTERKTQCAGRTQPARHHPQRTKTSRDAAMTPLSYTSTARLSMV